jgi:hypothetical protein
MQQRHVDKLVRDTLALEQPAAALAKRACSFPHQAVLFAQLGANFT